MKIGQRVDTIWGEGKILKCHQTIYDAEFLSMTPQEWIEIQLIPVTEDQLKEKWYSVAMDDGGSILQPESKIHEI